MKNNIPPNYYNYKGGFTNLTICEECDTAALYEDRHPVYPCPDCGAKLIEKVGRWISGSWFKGTKGTWEIKGDRYE